MSKASRTRAARKGFDEAALMERIGLPRDASGQFWTCPRGTVTGYLSTPGKVTLLVLEPSRSTARMQCTFPVGALDDMRAFVNGDKTAAQQRALVTKAAPDLLAACESLLLRGSNHSIQCNARCGPTGLTESMCGCHVHEARAAIAKARGES